jgi:4-hydroxy-2-oxoheptanedioate aldolase
MELPRNRFKQALAEGGPLYGLWLGLPDASVAELAGGAGFDWLLIDHEHGPFELRDVMHHLQAIAPYPVAPIVRPVEGNPALLKKMLDIGVQTFLIPMVETAEQAQELVSAMLYPPAGTRGLGTSMARAAQWNRVPGYLKKANDEICLLLQVETASAMKNIDAILAVEGVDGVFIGPSDLSASMGHIGDAGHPEVREAIASGLASIKRADKIAGLLCMDPALVEDYVAQGADFVGVGVDTLILGQGMVKLAQQFKTGKAPDDEKPQAGY